MSTGLCKGLRMKFPTITALFVALLAPTCIQAAPSTDRENLIGSWDLVSLENHGANGKTFYPFGEHPIGRITYTADGKMMAQIMRAERKPFATGDLYSGTADEKAAAYDSYVAYYGDFSVDPALHTVTHTVTGSLFPNWTGGQQMRFYELKGDELVLTTKPFHAQGTEVTAHVVWHRVK